MRITLKQLAVFRCVCEKKQVSRASRELCLSAPAISQNIKELESALDTALFVRRSTGLEMTDSARLLLPHANVMLDKAVQIEKLFADQNAGIGGALRIGSNKTFGNYVLSRKLPLLKSRFPTIHTSLRIDDNAVIEEAVLNSNLDVGFISGPPASTELESFACFHDRKCLVVSVSSPLCYPAVTLDEISLATWILDDEETTRRETLSWLKEKGITVSDTIVMSTMGAIKRAVGTGLGLSVLPFLAIIEEMRRGELMELLAPSTEEINRDTTQDIYAVYRKDAPLAVRDVFFKECAIERLQHRG